VLKGPDASTEYGTDAANGVIVIKTKRGVSGKPRWHAAIEDGTNSIPHDYPDFYYGYGHLTASTTRVECPLVPDPYLGSWSSSDGSCAVDSLVHGDPLNHAATTMYGVGSRQKYDLDVSGGSESIRYFLAGTLSNEIGAIKVPDVFVSKMEAAGYPRSAYNPNSENQRSGRGNTVFNLGSNTEVAVNAAYMSTYQAGPGGLGNGLLNGVAQGGSPTTTDTVSDPVSTPSSTISITARRSRRTGSQAV
jgi:hypothetical protein